MTGKTAISSKIYTLFIILISWAWVMTASAEEQSNAIETHAFGERGMFKMLYDCRQRPQALYHQDKLYLVYAGRAPAGKIGKSAKAHPMLTIYDPLNRTFSNPQQLGPASRDHHDGPIIWADSGDYLHVLFGCHKTPGTHLISDHPAQMGHDTIAWHRGPQTSCRRHRTRRIRAPSRHRMSHTKDGRPPSGGRPPAIR